MKKIISTIAFCLCTLLAGAQEQGLTVSPLFTDHAILQQGQQIPVWGKARKGATVTVTFGKAKAKAKASAPGYFCVKNLQDSLGVPVGVISTAVGGTMIESWRKDAEWYKKIIDLLIDRNDDTINLCEMKYTNAPYTITEEEDEIIRNRKETFIRETETEKTVLVTMITSFGLTPGGYADDIQCQLTMANLFR
jgi:hypothetical protein